MSWATSPLAVTTPSPGEVRLVGPEVLRELMLCAEEDGLLPVTLAPLGPAARGRLGLAIEDAIETALDRRGACPPGIGASTDLDASLGDQLYRARLLEFTGIALALPSLEGIANLAGALDADDSAVLRWWFRATTNRPLRLYLDAADRYVGVYGPPARLHEFLPGTRPTPPPPDPKVPAVAPETAASAAAMELSDKPPPVSVEPIEPLLDSGDDLVRRIVELAEASSVPPSVEAKREPVQDATLADSPAVEEQTLAPPAVEEPSAVEEPASAVEEPAREASVTEHAESDEALEELHETTPPPPAPFPRGPLYPDAARDWTTWARDIEAARGPKPLAAVERMFVTSYVPLRDALARGVAEPSASRVLDAWSTSFEHSYRDAFDALKLRGKRPTMVLDVPDLALRIGRLHGARTVQLVLVDGMRFDLGLRVEQRIKWRMAQDVALTERLLLWSALPSTTSVQLELLGRGPEGLKDFTGQVESEVLVARGRGAATPRRVKMGHRDLLKLDLVESRLGERGPAEAERLDDLADETADVLCDLLSRLPARTLAMVFGDHGFVLDRLDDGTAPARHGGASPEEVLVPAFAWLVGGVH